uniref:Uncharacterized protein n=1 Tax=Chromera velia CCMP2878 TaxID=1169474 RepID=A0A0G4FA64_9ALVE|eukprot:Cvel_15989.t1-p1 / transcript=Cvel_15989.t1 / gene=Cvel_15989 / organism=Chromera_velia_CCMP2878 / gene_product=hypothetical protein / transcript_product=hypothetical protein / location=Cvel_scaffold1211:31629-32576(+) / protein_length=316 / sequence_SO=supercontig / SO=protein_coding / is_pseudo=false
MSVPFYYSGVPLFSLYCEDGTHKEWQVFREVLESVLAVHLKAAGTNVDNRNSRLRSIILVAGQGKDGCPNTHYIQIARTALDTATAAHTQNTDPVREKDVIDVIEKKVLEDALRLHLDLLAVVHAIEQREDESTKDFCERFYKLIGSYDVVGKAAGKTLGDDDKFIQIVCALQDGLRQAFARFLNGSENWSDVDAALDKVISEEAISKPRSSCQTVRDHLAASAFGVQKKSRPHQFPATTSSSTGKEYPALVCGACGFPAEMGTHICPAHDKQCNKCSSIEHSVRMCRSQMGRDQKGECGSHSATGKSATTSEDAM